MQADPNNNNSEKLRRAVTLQGVRRHQAAFDQIATANGGNRFAGLGGHESSAEYVTSSSDRLATPSPPTISPTTRSTRTRRPS